MKGLIASYRRGRRTQTTSHLILLVDSVESKDKAASLVGKSVIWKSPAGKEIKGTVSATHGNKGAVRAIFEKGMPGQSVGTYVELQ